MPSAGRVVAQVMPPPGFLEPVAVEAQRAAVLGHVADQFFGRPAGQPGPDFERDFGGGAHDPRQVLNDLLRDCTRAEGDKSIARQKLWRRLVPAVKWLPGEAKPPGLRWRSYPGRGRKHHGTTSASGRSDEWHIVLQQVAGP